MVENEDIESSLVREDRYRLIGEHVDVASLAAYTGAWDVGIDVSLPPSATALVGLAEDARFRTILFQRLINHQIMLAAFDRLLETANRILRLLDAELGG